MPEAIARIRHALNANGTVTLTATPSSDRRPTLQLMCRREDVRRLAWAILSDLDPVEAELAADDDLQDAAGPARGVKVIRVYAGNHSGRRPKPGTLSFRILQLLELGFTSSRAIADEIDREPSNAAALLVDLQRCELAVRVDQGGQGAPATYATTREGQAWLRQNGFRAPDALAEAAHA